MNNDTFASINFGTRPTTVQAEVIEVTVDLDLMVDDYGKAFSNELYRRNPVRAESIGLTAGDLSTYFKSLIALRIDQINGEKKDWRKAKALYVPAWIEFVMTSVGEIYDTDRGFRILPVCSYEYDLDSMLDISSKLRAFKADGVTLLQDVMPRTAEGDYDTMTMILVNNFVYSMKSDAHPIHSYVAAYLGLKLKEDTAFSALYRVRYDDVEYIKAMLLREEKLY